MKGTYVSRPHIKDVLDTVVISARIGQRVHLLYKEGWSTENAIKEFLLLDGRLVKDVHINYCGLDDSVKRLMNSGFIYLGIGIVHK
jgi:hypothetical protein